jgi:hypothetical protein
MQLTEPMTGDDVVAEKRIRALEDQLRRERSARIGVERGLEALSTRLSELQRENRALREKAGLSSG